MNMAENERPRVPGVSNSPKVKKAAKVKQKKALGPLKMYILYKGEVSALELKRNQRDVLAELMKDRDLKVKEFVFERLPRGDKNGEDDTEDTAHET